MTNMNHVDIVGNLTRDLTANEADFGYIANGTARANISIAVNRSRKQGDEWVNDVNYFDVTIWGKTAENLKPYLLKGQKVGISGYLKQDRWEKDGQKHSKVTIVAENVELLGGKSDGNKSESPKFTSVPQQNNELPENELADGYTDPSDIPF